MESSPTHPSCRPFIRTLGAGAWLAGTLALIGCAHSIHASQPNIIFILADDLGCGDLGCYIETHLVSEPPDNARRLSDEMVAKPGSSGQGAAHPAAAAREGV
jgi:hypothetical protein